VTVPFFRQGVLWYATGDLVDRIENCWRNFIRFTAELRSVTINLS